MLLHDVQGPSKQNRARDASSTVWKQDFEKQNRPPHLRMDASQVEPVLDQLQLL